MADSVELLLDPTSDLFVLGDWAALEAEGLPNQSRHQSFSNAPHITLAAAARIDDRYDVDLAAAATGDALELVTAGFLVFPTRRKFVLARQVVADDALADLHRRIWLALDGVPGAVPTTVPGSWTPHITLGHGLTADQLAVALGILRDRPSERLDAGIVRRWDAKEKRLVQLGGGALWPPASGDLGPQ
ncbi:2'-5' RNA ligase family protein [Arthrobacter burdickii]|uniref:2'-5' RNA ligase family protein n=1 Tax=Arthrobacter burdickii TaxID=3035920 RepID=A0ABT8K0H3_9MICC|nr:2'-5' RNA ligase family protein [Arthrobacter burdickii]MDN4610082.1 2'-5' RNA ligase family protein [Arthrobacter burdickii]